MRKRNSSRKLMVVTLFVAAFLSASSWGFDVPEFRPNVVDTAGVLSAADIARLNATILKLRAESHIFAAVLVVPTTQPETIEDAAEETFRKWSLGQKGVDNGLLVLVAIKDRKMRIEVGYGLEGSIPDVKASRIIRGIMAPQFKQQNYVRGIDEALITSNDLVLHGDSIRLKDDSPSPIERKHWILAAIWAFLILVVPILVRATAVSRASRYVSSLQPTDRERAWWRIVCPNGISVVLTIFLLINPGIFFVLLAASTLGVITPLFIGFAYIFLGSANSGYLAMLKPSWREKFLKRPRKRGSQSVGAPQAFETSWGRGSSGSTGSSGSSGSSSSSGGGSSGGGGASGSW